MAVYEVYSQQVSYKYKTTLCSKATVVFVVSSIFATILPLIITYRSNGFWLKSDHYQEQPDVKFTHDYLLLLQTNFPHSPIQCRAQYSLTDDFQRHCVFKSYEEDVNHDGKVDSISVNVKVPLLHNESVYSVALVLTLDFHISSVCRLHMLSLAPIHYNAGLPGARLDVVADLRFAQKKPVDFRIAESLFSSTNLIQEVSLRDLLFSYSQHNYSTSLVNQYHVWATGRDVEDPFAISVRINIPESSIVYRPGFWQVMKWAWMQYLSIFVIFFHVFHIFQEYIFSNQLVPTYRISPLKKIQ
ncbi:hypothetical protein ONE63_010815 [Megalurothrips usitatus]|uniref:Transmembrane protein 231 n=1 Tax=Megalurothrips usitatus TaxID=439358 RepID=A0AAV7XL12_9NEOP|nr:hypothetical protein ONE63_010815 [Megalurothrips usitatus]